MLIFQFTSLLAYISPPLALLGCCIRWCRIKLEFEQDLSVYFVNLLSLFWLSSPHFMIQCHMTWWQSTNSDTAHDFTLIIWKSITLFIYQENLRQTFAASSDLNVKIWRAPFTGSWFHFRWLLAYVKMTLKHLKNSFPDTVHCCSTSSCHCLKHWWAYLSKKNTTMQMYTRFSRCTKLMSVLVLG